MNARGSSMTHRPWTGLLIGTGLSLLGGGVALAFLFVFFARLADSPASIFAVTGAVALMLSPGIMRMALLIRRQRKTEAWYTGAGVLVGAALLVFFVIVVIVIAAASGMPRHD
jgi:NADH:ubiquinone oxidoreductase subunit 6 (subunit J)